MTLGIFYYPWYGDGNNKENPWRHWEDGGHKPPATWNSRYMPSLGLYDSHNQTTVASHMKVIKDAGIDFVIWSWMGKDTFSDHSLDYFWNSTATSNPSGLKHCIYYEKEWTEGPISYDETAADMNYIKDKYAGHNTNPNPNYFRINNRAVIFVYNSTPMAYRSDSTYQIKVAKKWLDIKNKKAVYTVLKVFNGWQNLRNSADSWHQYAPSTPYAKVESYSSFASPGWWSPKEDKSRLARDPARFDSNVKTLSTDGTTLKTIQTWNEWTEGTSIEPEKTFGTLYVDTVKKYFVK
jgi:Glycosyltransferase WbsX